MYVFESEMKKNGLCLILSTKKTEFFNTAEDFPHVNVKMVNCRSAFRKSLEWNVGLSFGTQIISVMKRNQNNMCLFKY